MTVLEHHITGVPLNPIEIERKSLSYDDAVTAHIMRMEGYKYNHIAQHLGTNTHRLGEVFRAEVHHGSRREAEQLLANAA